MKKILSISLMVMLSAAANSQHSNLTLSAGFGMQGVYLGTDFKISQSKSSKTYLYGQVHIDGKEFNQPNIKFNGTVYSSDTRVMFAGIGICHEIQSSVIRFSPFAGVRYAYARFKDQALFDAIGEQTLIRYDEYGYQVGPIVENAYGNSVTVDAGVKLGAQLSKSVELVVTGAYSPVKFNTSETLYGQYWGEAPTPNQYHINYSKLRVEGGIRIHL